MVLVWGQFTGNPGGLWRGVMPSPIFPQSPMSLRDIDAEGVQGQL